MTRSHNDAGLRVELQKNKTRETFEIHVLV